MVNFNAVDKRRKIFCVIYLERKLFKIVPAKFRRRFSINNYPQKNQIYRWVHKFQVSESVNNLNKKVEKNRLVRKLTSRCPDNEDAVKDSVGKNPKKSLRRLSQELGPSRALLQRILEKDLQL